MDRQGLDVSLVWVIQLGLKLGCFEGVFLHRLVVKLKFFVSIKLFRLRESSRKFSKKKVVFPIMPF